VPRYSEEQRQRVHDALLQQGALLLAARGYRSVTVDDVALAAGVAKGTFYSFFPSKESLLEAVLQLEHERFHTEIHERFRRIDVRNKGDVKQAMHAVIAEAFGNPLFAMLLHDRGIPAWVLSAQTSQDKRLLEEDATVSLLTDLISRGQDAGVIREGEPGELARMFTRLLMAFVLADTERLPQAVASLGSVLDLLLDGLYTVS
jgi:AcrR family transcriptional regulator